MRPKRRQRIERRKRLFRLIILLLTIGVCIHFIKGHFATKRPAVLSDTSVSVTPTIILPSLTPSFKNSATLREAVKKALTGTKKSYGIAIKNMRTNESYFLQEHKVYASGSLYKLWVMAAIFEQLRIGKLHEDDILSEDVSVLNKKFHIDDDVAEKTDGKITATVPDALEQMITISDNYMALLLTEKIRLSNVALFLQKNGFSESKVGTNGNAPTTTPADLLSFFEKLYKGNLADAENTDSMITLLKQQRLNGKIPKYLPSSVEIAHKTGELNTVTHDAGIIYAENGDYIIVVLSDSNDRFAAEERIANISKATYDYFTKNTPTEQ